MFNDREAAKVLRLAQEMLQRGENVGLAIRKEGRVEQPIPVFSPAGELHSWYAPVTIGQQLVGFFEFQLDMSLMRYSSFQRHEDSLIGCPEAETWLDAGFVRRRMEGFAREDERLVKLFLSYDGSPTRLAWRGIFESRDGTIRVVHVAGSSVWESPSADE